MKSTTDWLWGSTAQDAPWSVGLLRSAARLAYVVGRDLAQGTLTLRAMSLVYTTLLSTVPLLAFSFSVLKGFGVHNQLEPVLLNLMEPLGERGQQLAYEIIGFVDNMQVRVLGALGLGLLVYTVISLVQKVESSLNYIWRVSTRRNLLQRFSDYLSVILVGPVLVFAALGLTGSILHTDWVERVAAFEPMRTFIAMAVTLVPYLLIIGAFTFVYIFVPNTKVRLRSALIGAVVAGLLWETAGWGFASFMADSTKYTAIYSGFAIVILTMIWLYLAWLILLVGASIAFYDQHPQYQSRRPGEFQLSIVEIERLAVFAMMAIGRRYIAGQEPWSARELATHLTAPLRETEIVLESMSAHGLITVTTVDSPRYLPGRPLDLISLRDVLCAVRRYPDRDDRLVDQE
ncbi:MAG: YihY/virulence factor BrkB family protein, partial [Gammaproteobacteria bacterium]|nr:YihY/virulence factor BrkB family protein [Gammaproteobacteria bacterium]